MIVWFHKFANHLTRRIRFIEAINELRKSIDLLSKSLDSIMNNYILRQ